MNHLTTYCYVKGCRLPECVDRYRTAKREYARRYKYTKAEPTYLGFKESSLAGLIIDILETFYGDWFTTEQLTDRVIALRPDTPRLSVSKAIWRLSGSGVLESRLVAVGYETLQPANKRGERLRMTTVQERRQWRRPCRAYLQVGEAV